MANPEQALANFDLIKRGKNALTRMDVETLDLLADLLAEYNQQWRLGISLTRDPD